MEKKIQSQRTIRHMTTRNKCRLGISIELKSRLVIAKVGVKRIGGQWGCRVGCEI